MATFETMTFEKFDNLLEQYEEINISEDTPYYRIIENKEKIYQQSKKVKMSNEEKKYYKDDYIKSLIEYGFYAKGEWDHDGRIALKSFEKVIKLDNNLPIAHYRIGHIYFKLNNLTKAFFYFSQALELIERAHLECRKAYRLDNVQINTAKKFLSYCALESFEKYKEEVSTVDQYPDLNGLINTYLKEESNSVSDKCIKYKYLGDNDYSRISYEEYEEIIENPSYIVLDGYNIEPQIVFEGKGENLGLKSFRLLCDGLENNLTDSENYFKSQPLNGSVLNNTINQRIRRLKEKTKSVGLTSELFRIEKNENQIQISTPLKVLIIKRVEE